MAQTALSKAVTIEGEGYRLQLSKILSEQPNAWRFELRKLNGVVPAGITLRLLTEDLQPFENNEVTADCARSVSICGCCLSARRSDCLGDRPRA